MSRDEWRNRIIEVRQLSAADLLPNPSNWRRHPQAQAAALTGLLATVGIAAPLVAYHSERSGGLTLIDGHLRQETGGTWPVAILDVDDSEADLLLSTIDPLGAMAEMDAAALSELLGRVEMMPLEDEGLASLIMQMASDAHKALPREMVDAEPQIDRAEELRQQWGTATGQLWQLGEHRLICGDCTDAAVVGKVMDGEVPDLILADPPYGVNIVAANGYVGGGEGPEGMIPFGGKKTKGYVGGGEQIKASPGLYPIQTWKRDKGLGSVGGAKPFGSQNVRGSDRAAHVVDVGKYAPIIGDETTATALRASAFYLEMYPQAVQVWWGANYYTDGLSPSSCWLVWDKETTGNFADCELAWTNQDKAAKLFRHRWNGMLRDSERERRWHPTQKPAALAAWVFEELSEADSLILDPFVGAGWSILGAEQTGRKARAIEMSEDYIAVCLQRFQDATAVMPILLEGS